MKGVELETTAVLARGLTANLFYSWLDGEYQSYVDNGVELAAVRHMQNAPRYQVGAGVEYAFPPLPIGNFILNVDYHRQDEFTRARSPIRSPGYDVERAPRAGRHPVPRSRAWRPGARTSPTRSFDTDDEPRGDQRAVCAPRSAGVDLVQSSE